MRERIKCIQLTRDDLEELEEGNRCSAGLMCRGLTIQNLPAHAGHYLESDPETGHEHFREAYAFRFPNADPDGIYCEACAVCITEEDDEAAGFGR